MPQTIIRQGDTFRKRIAFTHAGTTNPIDLTGYTAFAQLRQKPGEELKAEAEAIVDAEIGRVTVIFSAADTAALEPGEYGYDIRLVSNDDTRTIFSEIVKIIKPYTEL